MLLQFENTIFQLNGAHQRNSMSGDPRTTSPFDSSDGTPPARPPIRTWPNERKRGALLRPTDRLRDHFQAAPEAKDFVRHRLRIAAELGDNPITIALLLPLALTSKLGNLL